jgi:hypothetical protein
MLVSAPLSYADFTWAREIFNTLPGIAMRVLHGTKAQRLERWLIPTPRSSSSTTTATKSSSPSDDGGKDINVLCIDELAVFRNGGRTHQDHEDPRREWSGCGA